MLELSVFPTISHEHTYKRKGVRLIVFHAENFMQSVVYPLLYAWARQYDCRLRTFLTMFIKAYIIAAMANVVDHHVVCSVTVRAWQLFRDIFGNVLKIFTKIKIEAFSEVTISLLHIWHHVFFYCCSCWIICLAATETSMKIMLHETMWRLRKVKFFGLLHFSVFDEA
jgi:hypothetical protein